MKDTNRKSVLRNEHRLFTTKKGFESRPEQSQPHNGILSNYITKKVLLRYHAQTLFRSIFPSLPLRVLPGI